MADFSCQTDLELMLIIASDLFLNELNAAILALRDSENELCSTLQLQSYEQLESLRRQAKQLIGRVKSKAYRGLPITEKPSASLYPGIKVIGEEYLDPHDASRAALTGWNTGTMQPEKSWHFVMQSEKSPK